MLVTSPSRSFAVNSDCTVDTPVTSSLLLSLHLDSLIAHAPDLSNQGLLFTVEAVAGTNLTLQTS